MRILLAAALLLGGCQAAATGGKDSGHAVATAGGGRKGGPNLVFILTDNQGAWSLGCYGNRDIRTPNIDRLAAEGVRFTRAFASNGVCSPTRATLLTGLIPSQHGIHCYLGPKEYQMGPGAKCAIGEFRTLPKILADEGYVCGLSGKWHLGGNLTPQEGFRSWITMPHGHTTTFHGAEVIENGAVRKEPRDLTELWTERAVTFIEENRERPFFLFLAYNGPYGLGESFREPARNRHAVRYADQEIPSFPRGPMNPWLRTNKEFLNNPVAIRRYAAEVSGVDDGVGRVLDRLRELGLERDTLVVFTADQGWAGGQHGIWGMADHTRPLCAFDEAMRVPLILRQPGRVPAGTTSDLLVANYDVLPTLLSHLGLKPPPRLPGRDFSGSPTSWDDEVFYEFENTRVIRTSEWKLILRRHPQGPDELYDLKNDPGETRDLIEERPETRDALAKRLERFFERHADPQYDLWKGGRSKVKRLVPP